MTWNGVEAALIDGAPVRGRWLECLTFKIGEDQTMDESIQRRVDEVKELVARPKDRKQVHELVDRISRRGFVQGSMAVGALVAAAGFGQGVTRAEALNNLGILPDDLPAKKYRAATVEVGAASTWVSHGIETSILFGQLL